MSARTLFGALLWAVGLGTALAFATGQDRAVSIQVWLVGFSSWIVIAMLLYLLREVPMFPPRLIALFRWPRRKRPPIDHRPFGLRGLEGLMIRARDQERAHTMQLRPHLSALADYYLPRGHGINPQRDPDQVDQLLGDVAWLIDDTVTDRAPSLDEVETFFDRLLPVVPTDQRTSV